MSVDLRISSEVAAALEANQPVVALESTVITHGLAYPGNVETALAMEAAIRDNHAIPATIAVLQGQITVGLTQDEITYLGTRPPNSVRKCSRRDLPIAVGLGEDAATTVAGTMIVAAMAGIPVFATGGIGGVHRGQPFDVSADLMELGRTPVAVVCSGAKSILDLPLTLEVLETQGVPIIGLGTSTLPAFYSRSSGLPLDACIETPQEAARIIAAAHRLQASHGILITVPVPHEDALAEAVAEQAIEQATAEAAERHIHGKDVTPFVLGRVVELTDGESKRANMALLVNNARVAAAIAAELTKF
ncbi:MAG: pseudouridine-5-phosphate glycosidase [Anaerolineaceae bacterium]|nr:pseudouridine-5-phosphate glycosidase [Anaerolineaceae bacterium]